MYQKGIMVYWKPSLWFVKGSRLLAPKFITDFIESTPKGQIMRREVIVAITNGKLDLDPREQIFYREFDGRRNKRVLLKIIGE